VQVIAWGLPSAAVFEGMRAVLFEGVLRSDLLLHAVLANLAWMAAAVLVFLTLFRQARARGLLLQVGE
jgi:ABC-2 type transport system permease protein